MFPSRTRTYPPPSTRGTVASVEKQEVVSVSTRGMDGTVPRVEDRAIPRKQKDATVPRVEPPPKSDSCVKNTCDEDQKALARVREILG